MTYKKSELSKSIKNDITSRLINNYVYKNINFNYEESYNYEILEHIKNIMYDNYSKTDTICSVLKISRNNRIINFAQIISTYDVDKNIINNRYVSIGNSLISKDGEVRYNFLKIKEIKNNSQLFVYFKNYVNKQLESDTINILYEKFTYLDLNMETIFDYEDQYIDIYVLTLIFELYYSNHSLIETHTNPNFTSLFISKDDVKFYNNYQNKKEIDDFVNKHNPAFNKNLFNMVEKISPLLYYDLKNYDKLLTHSGKELLINKIGSSMKYSQVANGFALLLDWFFISGSSKNLYNNEEIINKLLNNGRVNNIVKYLYKSKIEIAAINNDNNLSTIYKKLTEHIKTIENENLYTNVSLCLLMENVGITIFNALKFCISKNKIIIDKIGNLTQNYNIFAKYLFNIIYSLYILNLNGVIHGDLHLNNITITINNTKNKGKYTVYDLSSDINTNHIKYLSMTPLSKRVEGNIYAFENYNENHSCVIDYSRSYIYIKAIPYKLSESDKNKLRKKWLEKEEKKYKKELKKMFPIIENNPSILEKFFNTDNFKKMFIMYSAIDAFKLTTSIYLYFKENNLETSINPKIINLLKNIAKFSFKKIEELLDDDAVNKNKYIFPNYEILQTFFKEFEFNNQNTINASSIFKLDNIKNKYDYFENIHMDESVPNIYRNNNKDLIKFINSQMENYNVTIMPDSINIVDNTINLTQTE